MATNVLGARGVGAHGVDPVTLEKTVSFNTTGIASGIFWFRMPARSQITLCQCFVETAFNAATTNVLVAGSGAGMDTLFDAATAGSTVTEGTIGTYPSAAALLLVFASETDMYIKYTQTGTAATTGKARFVISYVPFENFT